VANRLDPDINAYVAPSAIIGNNGRPQLYDRAALQLQLSELPVSDRRSMRSLAGKLGMSLWSVRRLCTVDCRPRGTLETKCVNVTANAYTRMVRNKVIPAIIAKFPQEQGPYGRRTVVRLHMTMQQPTSHFQWFDPKWIDTWFEHRLDWNCQLKEATAEFARLQYT
jgi:hypothetical protein